MAEENNDSKTTEELREAAQSGQQPQVGLSTPEDDRQAEVERAERMQAAAEAQAEAAHEQAVELAKENDEEPPEERPAEYVKFPGGVILQHKDGGAESYEYGQLVDRSLLSEGQLLHVDRFVTTDESIARPGGPANLDQSANLRAAIADSGQVQGTSSPIPGNYDQLSESEATRFIMTLENHPSQQAVVLAYEKAHANRRSVVDACTEAAQIDAKATEKYNAWLAEQVPSAPSMLSKKDAEKSASAAGNAQDGIGPVPVVDAVGRDIPLPPPVSN